MARTRQLDELRDEVRLRSDKVDDPFITDVELTRYINQSITRLYDKLVKARGDQYYVTPDSVSTVAGVNNVSHGFYRLVGIQWHVTPTNQTKLRRMEMQEFLGSDEDGRGWSEAMVPRYMPAGSGIVFYPAPQAVYSLTIWNVPAFADLSGDSDTFDGINGWEEWVVINAAIKVMRKGQEDTRELYQDLALIDADIEVMSQDRDDGQPGHVIDVEGELSSSFGTYPEDRWPV